MSASKELVEHIDADGVIIEVVTRAEVRAKTLRHRCTYVALVDTSDRLVVHRRAEWKDVYPGWWDIAFGGLCGVGEDWVSAARRELSEEAGLTGEALWPLGRIRYDADDGRILGEVYLVRSDAEPTCPDREVVEIDRVPIDHLDAWLTDRLVCTDSCSTVLPLLRRTMARD